MADLTHLGFVIPEYVVWKRGERYGHPGPGICAECGKARARTYARWDERPYCADCINKDLGAARPDGPQRHPDSMPAEVVYERMKAQGGTDDFELRSIVSSSAPNPRMYDKALS